MSANFHFNAPTVEELQGFFPAYEMESFIAQGRTGAVYRARQRSLDREVAIKILPRQMDSGQSSRESFEEEAKTMAQLNDVNLIGIYDYGEVEAISYVVMEYVEGAPLLEVAHEQPLESAEAAHLVYGICKGLAHAHESGIVHRDLRPANILLDSERNPKVGNFGLVNSFESNAAGDSVSKASAYIAPEVLSDFTMVDKRSDIFSVGVILYELLTGELPGMPYEAEPGRCTMDPYFDRIIWRATHPQLEMRYEDVEIMSTDLEPLLGRQRRLKSHGITQKTAQTSPVFLFSKGNLPRSLRLC